METIQSKKVVTELDNSGGLRPPELLEDPMTKLSERIRYFSFHLGVLHGTKKQAQKFFRGWADEVATLEQRLEELEGALTDIAQGNASIPDATLEEGRPAVTSFMWTYSQKRARQALAEEA